MILNKKRKTTSDKNLYILATSLSRYDNPLVCHISSMEKVDPTGPVRKSTAEVINRFLSIKLTFGL